jgi:aminoglycoside 3-N-acetyltransferase
MHPHSLGDGLGDGSPLGRLYAARADVVLLGVGHGNNTSLHLAETRALGDAAPMIVEGAPLVVDGRHRWVEYSAVDYDESDFATVGDAYAAAGGTVGRSTLGAGEVQSVPMRELVDFATGWFVEHRGADAPRTT